MNAQPNKLLIALAVSALLASGAIMAEPPQDPPPGPGMEGPGPHGMSEGERAEFMEFKLEKLHKALKLTQNQEAAWNDWSEKIKAGQPGWKDRKKEFEGMANLPVPERMEKMLAFAKERVARLEEHLAATKAFYEKLTPEQRQTFDKEFSFGHKGHGHGGPGGGRHWR